MGSTTRLLGHLKRLRCIRAKLIRPLVILSSADLIALANCYHRLSSPVNETREKENFWSLDVGPDTRQAGRPPMPREAALRYSFATSSH
jgi:hypothetical protein